MTAQSPLRSRDFARPGPTPVPAPLRYSIFVNGTRSGRQTVDFIRRDTGFIVRTSVSIQVEAGLLASFRFEQRGQEHWENGTVTRFDYVTHAGSVSTHVAGHRRGDSLVIDGPREQALSVQETATPSFWNPDILKFARVINPQTGMPVGLDAKPTSDRRVKLCNRTVEGQGFDVDSYFNGQIWFDNQERSLGFWFKKNGRRVDALRVL